MALKRKAPRRGAAKRRRMMRPRTRIPRTMTNAMIHVKRTYYTGVWTLNNVATTDFWKYYEPTAGNGFNNFGEFQSLFDSYRVNGIQVTFRPRFDNLAGPVTGATPMTVRRPYFAYIVDPQSTVSPSGSYGATPVNALLENGGKIVSAEKPISIYYRPYVAFNTSSGSGVEFRKSPWLRTNEINVTHRGFHIIAYTQGFGTNFTDVEWDVFVTMYASFKDIK